MVGASIKEIQTLTGYKTITMTARYAHLSPDTAASTCERMVVHNCMIEHAPKQAPDVNRPSGV
jgi:hypothetical protein